MPATCSLMEMVPLGLAALVKGPDDILRLALRVRPFADDFLLFLASPDLRLLDLCRLPRSHQGIQGFPLSKVIGLARATSAAGIIIVQERSPAYEVVRPTDYELTAALRQMLEETGIELLDHFLLIGDRIISVGGLFIDRGRDNHFRPREGSRP